jgi:catabolite repression protein CreC
MSMSSTISLALRRERSSPYLPLNSAGLDSNPSPRYHPAPSRNEIAVVQPVLVSQTNLKAFMEFTPLQVKQLDGDLFATIQFLPRSILTATRGSNIKLWIRPLALRSRNVKSTRGASTVDAQDLIPSSLPLTYS